MTKKKRTKPVPQALKKKTTRTDQERCYIAAKKVLRHFELEPELIDVFTKKQKQALLVVCFGSPAIKPERERTVPRQYIKTIHEETYQYMKNNFWGDPENRLTYLELSVYGLSFIINVLAEYRKNTFYGTPQEETAKKIYERLEKQEILNTAFKIVFNRIWHMTRSYSKFNFRLYGFIYSYEDIPLPSSASVRMTITLTAQDCQTKMFSNNGIERKAFRVLFTDDGLYMPTEAVVRRKKIFPNTHDEGYLNIYIQSHVLHRFAERMDALDPPTRNLILQYSFTNGIKLVTGEKRVLFACSLAGEKPAGYFTFFVQGSDLIINTFLPLISENTPEGKKFHEILPLSKEEIVYLGMDRISFFLKVDFEQIPVLKQALTDSGIWQTKLILDPIYDEDEGDMIDPNKTMFVKNYLEKRAQADLEFSES